MREASPRVLSRSPRTVGVLDIGSSKVACLIAETGSSREGSAIEVIGFESQRSRGVKAGVVVDLAKAEESVRSVIARAEEAAGVTLSDILVSVSCGRLQSLRFRANAAIEQGRVTGSDMARLKSGAKAYAERDGRALLHMNRLWWRVDGAPCQIEPLGMPGSNLSAGMHAVTADEPPLRNLLLLLEGCYATASGLVAAPYASALAVTTPEERRLGIWVVDIGGGTTTIAGFNDGQLVHVDAIPMGGGLVSIDIARALHTPLERAERIKAVYGTLVPAPSDEHEYFSYPLTGGEEGELHRSAKTHLSEIIRQRMALILDHVKERTASAGVGLPAGGRVVLTGGTSQMTGLAEFASHRLGLPVRVGRPQSWPGLPAQALDPQFSTVAGLLIAATMKSDSVAILRERAEAEESYLERVGKWLKQGFV